MAVRMTYMGTCTIAGFALLCTNMSITKKVEPLFFDHVVGLRDKNFTGSTSKGPDGGGGTVNRQKGIYRWSRSLATVNASGPLTIGALTALMTAAISGETVAANLAFYKEGTKKLTSGFISSLTVEFKAGDTATFSMELTGIDVEGGTDPVAAECQKLITWDKCSVTGDFGADVVSFSITVTNPPIPIYVADGLLPPKTIRIGMQEVKGSISTYNMEAWSGTAGTLTFAADTQSYSINVVYGGPTNTSASGGAFVSSIPFTGASDGPLWTSA